MMIYNNIDNSSDVDNNAVAGNDGDSDGYRYLYQEYKKIPCFLKKSKKI